MKYPILILSFLFVQFTLLGKETREPPVLTIKEALTIAIENAPDGKEITSIERLNLTEDIVFYYAVYDERMVPVKAKQLESNGAHQKTKSHQKMSVGLTVSMTRKVVTEILEDMIQDCRTETEIVPIRRSILPSN